MAEKLMIACDNPKCSSVGDPEWVPGQDGKRKRKGQVPTGPYGWHQGSGWLVGCGPDYVYYACSSECVGPAINEVVDEIRRKEQERWS
jgi:hypothetical protein